MMVMAFNRQSFQISNSILRIWEAGRDKMPVVKGSSLPASGLFEEKNKNERDKR